jgi:hypothetical protein
MFVKGAYFAIEAATFTVIRDDDEIFFFIVVEELACP